MFVSIQQRATVLVGPMYVVADNLTPNLIVSRVNTSHVSSLFKYA